MNNLEIIEKTSLLQDKEFECLKKLEDKLNTTFEIAQIFRTRTEMEISVLNDIDFPTPDSKFWQCIREQNVMFTELIRLSFNYRRNEFEIKKILKEGMNELNQINLDEKLFNRAEMQRIAKDRIREINEWQKIMDNLMPNIKFSNIDVNEHQLISYTQKFINIIINNNIPKDSGYKNLIAQLDKCLKICKEKNIIDKVLEPYEDKIKIMFKGE